MTEQLLPSFFAQYRLNKYDGNITKQNICFGAKCNVSAFLY